MRKFDLELAVGIFMIAGMVCLAYLTIKLGQLEVLGDKGYEIQAVFSSSGGLKTGSSVVIAGVEVGRVKKVILDDYQARVTMSLPLEVKIQEDAIASIKTKGLIGEKYVEISPGGLDENLEPGGVIRDTQPPIDIEQLISKYIFGTVSDK
ncbi:MAG: outer membrane lipid asymmetry maintenance protein MlaD [Desulfobacteraceae bacterium]|nr:MAG: outer membrane lipid asymmetry maintenance protein MlaD [Desulfobacteraceae bacterium]